MTLRGLFCTIFVFTMMQSVPALTCMLVTFVLGIMFGRYSSRNTA